MSCSSSSQILMTSSNTSASSFSPAASISCLLFSAHAFILAASSHFFSLSYNSESGGKYYKGREPIRPKSQILSYQQSMGLLGTSPPVFIFRNGKSPYPP